MTTAMLEGLNTIAKDICLMEQSRLNQRLDKMEAEADKFWTAQRKKLTPIMT